MSDAPERYEDQVTAGPGGAMTDDVGVITGDVTVVTRRTPEGRATVDIQYTGADEWYTLTGSPAPLPDDLSALHHQVLDRIREGGEAEVPGRTTDPGQQD